MSEFLDEDDDIDYGATPTTPAPIIEKPVAPQPRPSLIVEDKNTPPVELKHAAVPDSLLDDAMAVFNETNVVVTNTIGVETNQKVETCAKKVERFERIIRSGFPFFHSSLSGLNMHPDSLFLLVARSGVGKTTALCQCVALAVLLKKRVIYLSNELSEVAVLSKVIRMLTPSCGGDRKKAIALTLQHLTVYDVANSDGKTAQFDRVVPFMFEKCSQCHPDLIAFDQLNNAVNVSEGFEGKGVTTTQKFEYIAAQLGAAINKGLELPPIVVLQQANPNSKMNIDTVDIMEALRDSKSLFTYATHAVMFMRVGEYTGMIVDKVRFAHENTPREKRTFWSWSKETHMLSPAVIKKEAKDKAEK